MSGVRAIVVGQPRRDELLVVLRDIELLGVRHTLVLRFFYSGLLEFWQVITNGQSFLKHGLGWQYITIDSAINLS